MYTVGSGGSFTGTEFTPTVEELATQQTFVESAQQVYNRAKSDHAVIEANYKRDLKAFTDYHGRAPTDDELVRADMKHLPQSWYDELEEIGRVAHNIFEGSGGVVTEETGEESGEEWERVQEYVEVRHPIPDVGAVRETGASTSFGTSMSNDDDNVLPSTSTMLNQAQFGP